MSKPPLFFQRRFLPMWLGQSFGALSDNMNRQVLLIGVPFGAVALSGFEDSDAAIPIIGALFPIAMLIGSMYGGQFAEKFETQGMFRRTKFLEILLMLMAGFGLVTNQGWFLVAALFGMGLQSSSFNPVRQSAMPKYLETDELIRGNGLINAGLYACILLGYGIGGALISIKPNGPMLTAIVLVTFSVLGYISVWFAPKAAATNPDLKIDWSGIIPAAKMVKFTFSEPSVIRPLIGVSLFYIISTTVTVLLPIYGRDTLGADGSATTIIILLFAIGAGIGALGSAALSRGTSGLGFATLGIIGACLSTIGVYITSLSFSPEQGAALINAGDLMQRVEGKILGGFLCLTAACMGLYLAPLQAAIQRRAPNERRARILAVGNMMYAISAIIGSLSVLIVTENDWIHPEHAFIGVGFILFLIALYMIMRRNTVPVGLYDEKLKQN